MKAVTETLLFSETSCLFRTEHFNCAERDHIQAWLYDGHRYHRLMLYEWKLVRLNLLCWPRARMGPL